MRRKTRSVGPPSQMPDDFAYKPKAKKKQTIVPSSSSSSGSDCSTAKQLFRGPPMSQKHLTLSDESGDDGGGKFPADASESEYDSDVVIDAAGGTERHLQAMMGNKPQTAEETYMSLVKAGIKSEEMAELGIHLESVGTLNSQQLLLSAINW